MNFEELRLFRHLAETLHFGRSADGCNISPSALSRTIQRLEEEVGVTLFYRDKRHVSLTPEGEIFLAFAAHTRERYTRMREELATRGGEIRGEVSLFCSVTAAQSLLERMLPPLRRQYPGVSIRIETGDSADAIHRVQAGETDLSIAARPERLPGTLDFLEITQTPLVFIAPAVTDAPERRIAGTVVPDLPFILADRALSRDYAERWFREHRVSRRIYAEVAGHEAIIAMVQLGFGVGVVPQLVLDQSPLSPGVRAITPVPGLPGYLVGLCAQKRGLAIPTVRAFWDVVATLSDSDNLDL